MNSRGIGVLNFFFVAYWIYLWIKHNDIYQNMNVLHNTNVLLFAYIVQN